ncbi:MAG: HEAT repeat domain-containing protein, partial [Pirellulales bacterium]|nr:HEAT repeat domain-containing protein [Pirellulales bacterium]
GRAENDPWIIRPYAGGQITLEASGVTDVEVQRPREIEYWKKRIASVETVADHLAMAQWCRENKLKREQKFHLQQVLQIDPDHADARRLLGYSRVDGAWMTRDEKMRSRGYVRDGNRWVLPQERDLREKRKKQKKIEREWHEKVKRYTKWMDGGKRASGREHLLDIKDPNAASALIYYFEKSQRQDKVEVLAQALANVGTPKSFEAIVNRTMSEANDDLCYFCLELLEEHKPPNAIPVYVEALRSQDNGVVNRAARGLRFVGDSSVVRVLINALVTQHKYKVGNQNPGGVSTSFGGAVGSKGTGFVSGGGPKIVAQNARNREVLAALRSITGKDFDYDMGAWTNWYESQKPPAPKINSRRDDG